VQQSATAFRALPDQPVEGVCSVHVPVTVNVEIPCGGYLIADMERNDYERWCDDAYDATRADEYIRTNAGRPTSANPGASRRDGDYENVGFQLAAEKGEKGAVVLWVTLLSGVGRAKSRPVRGSWRKETAADFAGKAVLLYGELRDKYGP
jgi:hypothetical protein